MQILAVDTATEVCGVALAEDGHLRAELGLALGRTHAKVLMAGINAVLDLAGVDLPAVDAFAVTRGPGSFTGLRIGISTVKGLAVATGKPLVGVTSLSVLAHQASDTAQWVCAMIDARRQEVYWSLHRRQAGKLETVVPEQVGACTDVAVHIDAPCRFIGNGAQLYRDELLEKMGAHFQIASHDEHTIRPGLVARLGGDLLVHQPHEVGHDLTPLYLRKSDAELNRKA